MKKNKRYVALILCVAMLTALMPTVSFAASVPMFGCDALIELEGMTPENDISEEQRPPRRPRREGGHDRNRGPRRDNRK